MAFVSLGGFVAVVYATPSSIPTVIEEGSGTETASWTIFTDGSAYYGKNGTDGSVPFSGSNASQVINNAIDTVTANGGTIFLKSGVYTLTASITLKNNTHLVGEGWGIYPWQSKGTVLQKGANINLISVDGASGNTIEGWSIRNLQLNGQGDTYTGAGIYVDYGKYFELENLWVRRFGNGCINITSSSLFWISDSHIVTSKNAPTISIGSASGDLVITDSDIGVGGFDGTTGNHTAIYFSGGSSGRIENNKIHTSYYGVHAVASSINLVGNWFNDLYYGGIFISGGKSVVVGNYFYKINLYNSSSVMASGIYVHTTFCTVQGNTIDGGTDAYMRYGIYESGQGGNNTFQGNTIQSFAVKGIYWAKNTTIVRGNIGYITEYSGTAEASDTDYIAFSITFAGTPEVLLTVEESDDAYIAQPYSVNTTHFRLFLADDTGAAENVDKTINWHGIYQL